MTDQLQRGTRGALDVLLLLTRASKKYHKLPGKEIESRAPCTIEVHNEREYVILRNGYRVLAVFHITANGCLRESKMFNVAYGCEVLMK